MLLALNSSVILDEQIDCLARANRNDKIYDYGKSDLKDILLQKEKRGLFGRRYEYKIDLEKAREAEEERARKEAANKRLDDFLNEYRTAPVDDKTRTIRKGPSHSKTKGKDNSRDSR